MHYHLHPHHYIIISRDVKQPLNVRGGFVKQPLNVRGGCVMEFIDLIWSYSWCWLLFV
jgi:hypothetical protein